MNIILIIMARVVIKNGTKIITGETKKIIKKTQVIKNNRTQSSILEEKEYLTNKYNNLLNLFKTVYTSKICTTLT